LSKLAFGRSNLRKARHTVARAVVAVLGRAADVRYVLFGGGPLSLPRRLQFRLLGVRTGAQVRDSYQIFIYSGRHLSFGSRATLGGYAQYWDYDAIHIGDDFVAGPRLMINSGSHDPESLVPQSSPIRIGNRVWCGANVTILAGVTIGDDVVIGAGSVVIKDLPSGCVAAGVPARKIRDLNRTHFWRWCDNQIHDIRSDAATADAVG
jgi:maltose O-acetyltransferase